MVSSHESSPSSRSPAAPATSARRRRLDEGRERFVALWGQMGASWGIPRTMAEVHALLFIVGRPMNTDEVMRRLGISRGNASMTLRALVDWGIVARVHVRGDRKEYFLAEQDVWKMFRTILRQRKKKEIDPLIEQLDALRGFTGDDDRAGDEGDDRGDPATDADLAAHDRRLEEMLRFMHMVESISQRFISPSGKGLQMAARLLARAS